MYKIEPTEITPFDIGKTTNIEQGGLLRVKGIYFQLQDRQGLPYLQMMSGSIENIETAKNIKEDGIIETVKGAYKVVADSKPAKKDKPGKPECRNCKFCIEASDDVNQVANICRGGAENINLRRTNNAFTR